MARVAALLLLVLSVCAASVFGGVLQTQASAQDDSSALRLIEFGENHRVWLSPEEVAALPQPGKMNNFIDVTDYPNVVANPETQRLGKPIPSGPKHQKEVEPLLPKLKLEELRDSISHLSEAFFNRFYTTQTGKDAAEYLHDRYQKYAEGKDHIEVKYFQNTFLQPSVIARIKGDDSTAEEIVILGGHEDSTAGGANARSPGADDDATGSSTVLEVFRVLTEANFRPHRTVEFHAYAAEEAGLLGSQAIASKYRADGVKVAGMMQLDMTGYTPAGRQPVVGLITDFVNATLTKFVSTLIDEYCNIGWVESRCGYGCSDHASWTRNGYPSSFPFETPFNQLNPYIHTNQDLLNKLTLEHSVEFAKLGLAFVVEMSLD